MVNTFLPIKTSLSPRDLETSDFDLTVAQVQKVNEMIVTEAIKRKQKAEVQKY